MEPDTENQTDKSPTESPTDSPTCCKCGSPTSHIGRPPSLTSTSPPPSYLPIRAPAINLSPEAQRQQQQSIILAPVPHPQRVIPALPPFQFQPPTKKITSLDDIKRFVNSQPGTNFLGFIASLSDSVKARKISDPCHESNTVKRIMGVIEKLSKWVDEIEPVKQAARYGNASFRTWHGRVVEKAEDLMLEVLDGELKEGSVELSGYFVDSFGNPSRIDYGTGHETTFAAWLYCLARLGVIKEEDFPAVVLRVFVKYLDLMRKLQLTYNLEPAGSHGVWGLDDYHFLPFIFGAAQLIGHKYMKPKSIHNQDILENFADEYMYLSCIVFIKKVKKGLFAEHSPMLDDISGVPNWNKVNSGLLKMYKAEVLEKVPIMQHFLFGSLIKWE